MTQSMQQSGPGKKGLWIGAILMVIGVAGGIALVVFGAKSVVDTVNSYRRVDVRTGGSVSFSKAGRYDAFYEHPGIRRRRDLPPIQITLSGPGGQLTIDSDINRTNTTEHYSFGDHEGVRITRFNVAQPGRYQVRVLGEPIGNGVDEIAFGRGSITEGILGVIGGVLGGGLVMFIGLIVLITTAVRRGRYRRRMSQAGYGTGCVPPGGFASQGPWTPAGPGDAAGSWSPPAGQPGPPGQWPPPAVPPGPPGRPPGWAPPPGQPPASGRAQPSWPPPAPPSRSGPASDPDRPGWGAPGQ